ncbi:hypothetical protein K1719_000602 [Acacia pycnantha]|nr:hypothetical protein K1719_000602 [Acacia pycnantha]
MEVSGVLLQEEPCAGVWKLGLETITIPSRSALSLQRKLVSSAAPCPITRLIRTTVISKSPVTCTRKTSLLTAMIVVLRERKFVLDTIVFLQVKEKKRQKKVSLSKGSSNGFEILSGGKGERLVPLTPPVVAPQCNGDSVDLQPSSSVHE